MGIDACMFVRHNGCLTEFQIRRLSAQLVKRFGSQRFGILREEKHGSGPRHALSVITDGIYTQDGDDIVANPGEQFIECHLWTRYYGEGYERGDWLTISAVAAFLELNIPKSEVWYGGDSSGVCAEPLTRETRERITLHWLTQGHEPYRSYTLRHEATPLCDFCGDLPMHNTGCGQGHTFWQCDGCGLDLIQDNKSGLLYYVADPDHKLSGHFSGPGKPYVRHYEWSESERETKAETPAIVAPVQALPASTDERFTRVVK